MRGVPLYKVLIIDDESIIVEGLIKVVLWPSYRVKLWEQLPMAMKGRRHQRASTGYCYHGHQDAGA